MKHCTTYNFKIRDFYNDTFCQNEMFAKENENGNDYKMGELFRGFKFKSHYKPISAFSEKHLLQLLLHISSTFGVEKKRTIVPTFFSKECYWSYLLFFFFKRVLTYFLQLLIFNSIFFIDLKPNNRKNSPSSDEATILPLPQHYGGLAASLKKRRPFHSLMAFNLSRESRNSVRQI